MDNIVPKEGAPYSWKQLNLIEPCCVTAPDTDITEN